MPRFYARLLCGAVLLIVVFFLFVIYEAVKTPAHEKPWYYQQAPCRYPDSVLDDLATLASHMHDALQSVDAPHVLCYGTLWGALRQGRLLPWDNNIDMCALDSCFANVSTSRLKEKFSEKKMALDYDWMSGTYHVRFREVEGHIYMFTKSASDISEMAVPGGQVRSLRGWFSHEEKLMFPLWLLEPPFHTVKFYGKDFPVPHEGFELQKYLYPDDWWQEVHPPGCN